MSRLFFGLELQAPWPSSYPKARLIEKNNLHATMLFLGEKAPDKVVIPTLPPLIGTSGFFDKTLFLPEENPRCVSWHIFWFNQDMDALQKQLTDQKWLSHLTVARRPFNRREWSSFFTPLPCFASAFQLYKSLGFSQYEILWTNRFLPPFEEIEHMADIAFMIYGKNLSDLYANALTALAFKHPPIICLWTQKSFSSLDEVIFELNHMIQKVDIQNNCPFKAVSHHGNIEIFQENFIMWEMIVDV